MASTHKNDYYRVLGLLRTCSKEEITAAYYLLARKCHPDLAANDPQKTARFKLINEAYEVLSDAQKRREYDARHFATFGRRVPVQHATSDSPDPPRTFENLSPPEIEVDLPILPEEARHGGPCRFVLTLARPCTRCAGQGSDASGVCSECDQGTAYHRQQLEVVLPEGVQNGASIRVAVHPTQHAARPAHVRLRIRIRPQL